MKTKLIINGQIYEEILKPDQLLLDFLREKGFRSAKRGCDTSNCGLCTVFVDGKPVLSCSILAVRCDKKQVQTLEGLQKEAEEIGRFIAEQGADQCGFCNPGLIMNIIAMKKEKGISCESDILAYLQGNLCRCSGYVGHLRAIKAYLDHHKIKERCKG